MDVEDNNQNNGMLGLILKNDQRVEVDPRFKNVSVLVKELSETNNGEDIPISQISTEMLNIILDYCKRHNWNPPKVSKPLQSAELSKNLSEQDYLFIKDYPIYKDNRLNDLLQAAYYLQIQTLYDVCICRIASEFYFGKDQSSFDDLKKKLSVTEDLTIEQEEKIQKEYPWIQ
ncbi:hypothetical protein ABPG74_018549 [Tetrahymena malaccensis]